MEIIHKKGFNNTADMLPVIFMFYKSCKTTCTSL